MMKKTRVKKCALTALMVAASASMLFSCNGKKEDKVAAASDSSSSPAAAVNVGKPASITWMVHDGLHKENGTDKWAEEFERISGIKMNLKIVSNNEYTQLLDLAFASKDTPDVFDLTGDGRYASFVRQSAVADLTDLVKASPLYSRVDSALWNSIAINGRYYGIPKEKPNGTVSYVRKDWLERLGMKEPTTYAEFIEMLRAFKTKIPECQVPFTAPGLFQDQYLREFYQDATPDFTKVDGKWIDGMSAPSMKAALQRLQDAYKEGLIDMEVVTNKTSTCRDEWYAGKVGVFAYWAGQWGQTLQERLQLNVPDGVVEPISMIKESHSIRVTPTVWAIPSSRSEAQIAQIFKYFMEFKNDGAVGQVLFQSGVEGLHWKQNGEYLEPLPQISNPKSVQLKAFVDPVFCVAPLTVADKKMKHSDIFEKSLAVLNENVIQLPILPTSRTYLKISSDLKLLKEEILAKVVMGTLSVDEGLAKYNDEANALGVDKVVAEFNE